MQVEELAQRYNVGESQLNKRIRFLGLKPLKNSHKSRSFSLRDILLLDNLHQHLSNNGQFRDYIPPSLESLTSQSQQIESTNTKVSVELSDRKAPISTNHLNKINNNTELLEFPTAKIDKQTKPIEERADEHNNYVNLSLVESNNSNNHLQEVETYTLYPDAINKEIEEYFALNQRLKYNGILEELASRGWGLTTQEVKELTGNKPRKNYYQYDCFVFVRQGKIGNQITWRVVKQPLENYRVVEEAEKHNKQDRYQDIEQEIIEAEKDFVRDLQLIL